MSETDDTDDLLLIPPDFFVLDSELEDSYATAPYYEVVDTLISQVNSLENRINCIERSSESSILSSPLIQSSLNNIEKSKLMSESRNSDSFCRENDICKSTQSTPQKPRTIFKLNSLPTTPSTVDISPRPRRKLYNRSQVKVYRNSKEDLRNINETTSDKNKIKILNDIDEFITNVKTLQKISAARNLKEQFENEIRAEEKMDYPDGYDLDKMLQDIEKDIRLQDIVTNEKQFTKNDTWKVGDSKFSVPDLGFGIRDLIHGDSSSIAKPAAHITTNKTNTIPQTKKSSKYEENLDDSCSASSQVTVCKEETYKQKSTGKEIKVNPVHEKAFHVLNLHKNYASNKALAKGDYADDEKIMEDAIVRKSDPYLQSMSLKELWNQPEKDNVNVNTFFNQRLEEEKIKRQHCEKLIHNLQSKILELQEKLAVAIEVDKSKDDAILRFHDAWEKVALRLQSLNKEKNNLEEDIREFQTKSAFDLAEAAKKIAHYECETSKALNLAHNSQEKLTILEKQHLDTCKELETIKEKLIDLESKYTSESDKVKHLVEIVAQKEIELNENKNILSDAKQEIAESKKAVEICQAEFLAMKTQYTQLELSSHDDKEKLKLLEEDNKKLLNDIEVFKKSMKNLEEQLRKSQEQNEKNKIELRDFYQDQVETVVREKLKEFREQLEEAENSLQEELKKRELAIVKSAATHIQEISNKHQLEVQLLEEKHSEEIRLYHVKLSQSQRLVADLQEKFRQQKEYKISVAQQLQKVMEAQWQEAIKILNNSRSPGVTTDSNKNALEELNMLKSKSYSNLEELLNVSEKKPDNEGNKQISTMDLNVSGVSDYDTYNSVQKNKYKFNETPVTSKTFRSRQQIENDLHRYINLIMNKPVKPNGIEKDSEKQKDIKLTESTIWQPPSYDDSKQQKYSAKDKRLGKPPWK